jgi:hypothetical protein
MIPSQKMPVKSNLSLFAAQYTTCYIHSASEIVFLQVENAGGFFLTPTNTESFLCRPPIPRRSTFIANGGIYSKPRLS